MAPNKLHARHVRRLTLDVGGAHVDFARHAVLGADRRDGDAVLTGPGLGDDARLAHPAREQNLPEAVVDLVRAGVIELFALEVDFGAAELGRHALGVIERARPAGVMQIEKLDLALKFGIGLRGIVSALEIEDQRHQSFGDEAAAENDRRIPCRRDPSRSC